MNHDYKAADRWRKKTGTVIPPSRKPLTYHVMAEVVIMWDDWEMYRGTKLMLSTNSKNKAIAELIRLRLMVDGCRAHIEIVNNGKTARMPL